MILMYIYLQMSSEFSQRLPPVHSACPKLAGNWMHWSHRQTSPTPSIHCLGLFNVISKLPIVGSIQTFTHPPLRKINNSPVNQPCLRVNFVGSSTCGNWFLLNHWDFGVSQFLCWRVFLLWGWMSKAHLPCCCPDLQTPWSQRHTFGTPDQLKETKGSNSTQVWGKPSLRGTKGHNLSTGRHAQ